MLDPRLNEPVEVDTRQTPLFLRPRLALRLSCEATCGDIDADVMGPSVSSNVVVMTAHLEHFLSGAPQLASMDRKSNYDWFWKPLLPLFTKTIHCWTFCVATIRSKMNPLPSRINIATAT